jgi:aldehyde:ferredoxin oxidoreductase
MARAYNAREGFSAKDDRLPSRCFEPISSGPLEGVAIDQGAFAGGLTAYCRMSGLDEGTGAPTTERLAELDIPWVAEELTLHVLPKE